MGATDAKQYSDLEIYRRILRWARPYWLQLAGMLALGLLSTPIALLGPVPLKIVVDHVLGDHPLPAILEAAVPGPGPATDGAVLWLAAVLVLLVALARQAQEGASAFLHTYTGSRLVLEFRARLFRHAQRLSLAFHDTRGPAEATYRIQWDASAIQHIAVNGLIPFLQAGFTLVAMVVVTARIDPVLAVIALAITPPLYLITRSYRQPLRRRYRQVKELETSALSVIQEVLPAVRVVKAFGQEDYEERRFVQESRESVQARVRLSLFQGGFDALVGLTTAAGTALVLFVGALHVQQGTLTLGALLLVMSYLAQLYAPLRTISSKAADIQSSLAGADRAFALLDENPEVPQRPDARSVHGVEGRIVFRGVTFGYEPGHPVLKDATFEVEPGDRVGISGRTGAGKTTLMNLLTRFYDPDEGRITLDGVDLRDYRLTELRDQFAIVLQEPVLFSSSIAENIAYALPAADMDAIVEAARAANAHDFILDLPRGYETEVGDRGMLLSGGERQRISLARAFLRDAPILILDEPTSAVDVATEAAIMEAMERLMEGRTTFMIAHRLSTLDYCNVRLELADGRVARVERAERHAGPARASAL